MHREGEEVHVDEVEARAGYRGRHVLFILLISLSLLVLLYAITLVIGTATAPYQPTPVVTSAPA